MLEYSSTRQADVPLELGDSSQETSQDNTGLELSELTPPKKPEVVANLDSILADLQLPEVSIKLGEAVKQDQPGVKWGINLFRLHVETEVSKVLEALLGGTEVVELTGANAKLSLFGRLKAKFFPSEAFKVSLKREGYNVDVLQIEIKKNGKGFAVSVHPILDDPAIKKLAKAVQTELLKVYGNSADTVKQLVLQSIAESQVKHTQASIGASEFIAKQLDQLIQYEDEKDKVTAKDFEQLVSFMKNFESSDVGKKLIELLADRNLNLCYPSVIFHVDGVKDKGNCFERKVSTEYHINLGESGFYFSAQRWEFRDVIGWRKDDYTDYSLNSQRLKELFNKNHGEVDIDYLSAWISDEIEKVVNA